MNNYLLENKYKERTPELTKNIIQNFFESKGFVVKFFTEYRSESLTWFAKVFLLWDKNVILHTNGKGTNEQFALASGFGELYERYCNKIHIGINSLFSNYIFQKHYETNGYYFSIDEKEIPLEDLLNYEQHYAHHYEVISGQIQAFFKMQYNNKFVGVPYKNIINSQENKYLDPRIVRFFRGSTGMSCGNSFKEAFNQGFSEILEHYWGGLYLLNPFDKYYSINLNAIENEALKKHIAAIQAAGQQLYIYDMSYQLHMPILMGVLVCKNHRIHVNISSFPIFDIALERIITELYQGDLILRDTKQYQKQLPYRNYNIDFIEGTSLESITGKQAFPEDIFFKTEKVDKESDIFLCDKNASNIEIFNYYQNLIKKLNMKIYYWDVSQCKEMTALHIYADGFSGLQYSKRNAMMDQYSYDKCYNYIFRYINYFNDLIKYKKYNIKELKYLSSQWTQFTNYEQSFIEIFISSDYLSIYRERHQKGLLSIYILYNLFNTQGQQQLLELAHEYNYYNVAKYILLYSYFEKNNYTKNEIMNIMTNIYNLSFTQEDYSNITDIDYLLKKIYLEHLIEFYNNIDNQYINIISNY